MQSKNGDQQIQEDWRGRSGVKCPACAGSHLVLRQKLTPDLLFPAAFEIWMSHRRIETNGVRTNASYLAPKTDRDYVVCAKALEKYFGCLRLGDIHAEDLMEYQQARASCDPEVCRGGFGTWAHAAGANCIRKEIALLTRILKSARAWDEEEMRADLQNLRPYQSDEIRALTAEEQHRFLHVASSREDFRLVYCYAIVALQTTAGSSEMRHLRLGDVFLEDRILRIQRMGAKNKYRIRAIPLVTEDAIWAMGQLLDRARSLGAINPSDYLFPIQEARGYYDPSRPMSESGFKKPWDRVRRAAGLPALRIYDLRHTGITRMAEAGVPLPVAMSFAGHMSQKTQQHYIAISMAAQRSWGNAVWAANAAPGAASASAHVSPAVEVKRRPSSVPVRKPGPKPGGAQIRKKRELCKPVQSERPLAGAYSQQLATVGERLRGFRA